MFEFADARKQESKPNLTGIPDVTKKKFESASGLSFDDVRIHYNSDKPAQLQALAYTQGNQVYIGPGQEKHLGHELGHVIQQKQGRVKPTTSINGMLINDEPLLEKEAERESIQFYSAIEKNADEPITNIKTETRCAIQTMQPNKNTPYSRTYFAIRDAVIGNAWLQGILNHILGGDIDADGHPTGLHAYTREALPGGFNLVRGTIRRNSVHEITYTRNDAIGEKTSTMFPARLGRDEIMIIIALKTENAVIRNAINDALVIGGEHGRFINRDEFLGKQLGDYNLHFAGDTVYPVLP